MNEPDRLVNAASVPDTDTESDTCTWIVRLERRDIECQFRFVDRRGNVNSRLSSAMMMTRDVAKQYAKAISEQHPKYKAAAMLFKTAQRKMKGSAK